MSVLSPIRLGARSKLWPTASSAGKMPHVARSNYERMRSVPQHPHRTPAHRQRLLGKRLTKAQARLPPLIAAQTRDRAALHALGKAGRRKQRQRPRAPVPRTVRGAAGAIITAAGAWANSRKHRWARPHPTSPRTSFWMRVIARVLCCFRVGLALALAAGNGSARDGRDTKLPLVPSSQRGAGPGDGLQRAPQDGSRTPALAGLAVAALRPGIDTACAGRWALVRCKNHRES